MSESISDRIYNAQCLGNIEPVEYIVPYPNIFSLLEGENVKFGNNSVSYTHLTLPTKA